MGCPVLTPAGAQWLVFDFKVDWNTTPGTDFGSEVMSTGLNTTVTSVCVQCPVLPQLFRVHVR